jgi:predicted DNA-binding protein YlxM (UPF0122 family)
MIDNLSRTALLMDFYRGLLTVKQRTVMSYYFEDDMSLSEISEEMNISRQAVHDIIKRSEKILEKYETQLKLVKKYLFQNEKLKEVYDILKNDSREEYKRAAEIVKELINQ